MYRISRYSSLKVRLRKSLESVAFSPGASPIASSFPLYKCDSYPSAMVTQTRSRAQSGSATAKLFGPTASSTTPKFSAYAMKTASGTVTDMPSSRNKKRKSSAVAIHDEASRRMSQKGVVSQCGPPVLEPRKKMLKTDSKPDSVTRPTKSKPEAARGRKKGSQFKMEGGKKQLFARRVRCYGNDLVRLGASGYTYSHWRHSFYGEKKNMKNPLEYYGMEFDAVELNTTFYRVPDVKMWLGWREQASKLRPSFIFAVKAHQFFTHMKRLKVDEQFKERWAVFWERCQLLGPHLGPVLFQLPPTAMYSLERLQALAALLPPEGRFAFEFRHRSWFCLECMEFIKKQKWCMAMIHVTATPEKQWVKSLSNGWHPDVSIYEGCDWGAYIRLHGTKGQYIGRYTEADIELLADRISRWTSPSSTRKTVYVMCNNTDDGDPPSAIADLRALAEALRRRKILRSPSSIESGLQEVKRDEGHVSLKTEPTAEDSKVKVEPTENAPSSSASSGQQVERLVVVKTEVIGGALPPES